MADIVALKHALTLQPLLDAAFAETGASGFNDESFVPNLEKALEIPARGELSANGLQLVHANYLRFLVNRLRWEADVERHPEILDEDVSDPIILLGLPRSGTTMFQRIVSANPAFQATYAWRLFNPAPFPGEQPGDPSPRIRWTEQMMGVVSGTNEDYKIVHEFTATAEEESSFVPLGNFDYVMQHIPTPDITYRDWARSVDRTSPLGWLRRMLQYLQWQDGGRRDRPWVIRNPGHTGELAELLQVFPNATFAMTQRDLRVTMASSMKMMCEIRPQHYDSFDPREVADDTVEYWSYELHRYLRQRDELAGRVRLLEVPYHQLMADPIGVAQAIYALHDFPWTDTAEQSMLQWQRDNPRHKHGKNEYSLEDYGWSEEKVEAAFGDVAVQWRGY